MQEIRKIIATIAPVSLEDVNSVGLMNRVDTKFIFHKRLLPQLLTSMKDQYAVMEIKGERLMPYRSDYYDTDSFQMLRWHHNGKLNRYKIRKRKYLLTGDTFLEVKFKNNKGKTEKYRKLSNGNDRDDRDFISEKTPFSIPQLNHVMNNQFDRIMLLNNNKKERITIDLDVGFSNGDDHYKHLKELVVLEIKSERNCGSTSLKKALKEAKIYPASFSKFVTGMYMHHKDLKYNRFKVRIMTINKILEKNIL